MTFITKEIKSKKKKTKENTLYSFLKKKIKEFEERNKWKRMGKRERLEAQEFSIKSHLIPSPINLDLVSSLSFFLPARLLFNVDEFLNFFFF